MLDFAACESGPINLPCSVMSSKTVVLLLHVGGAYC